MDKMFLNKYENIIIVNPELKYIGDIKEKIFNILGEFYIDSFEDMGNKKLPYEIQKIKTGHYIKTEFYAKDYEIINELERYFRINDDVLKVKCDVLFVPIGGIYTMDYKEAANYTNTINPSVVIPTHYGLIVGDVNLGQKFKSLINDNTSCEIYIK